MEKRFIDINCDVGEGVGNEAELFPLISSCNIACGGHSGDLASMTAVVRLAKKHRVKIGAHPSYPDIKNFGRLSIKMDTRELSDSIKSQVETLAFIAKKEKIDVHHIKPHGALYNDIAKDENLASVFLEAVTRCKNQLFIYVPPKSIIEKLALKKGFKIKREAFGDRNYTADLRLVSRKEANALILNPESVCKHLIRMVKEQYVNTISGERIKIKADTYCIHGDTPNALQILTYLSKELHNHKIYISK
ncbi:5-oxoprolinase subunit PxpA [Costertonia aggregata]|uniref:5-oxoprolinase subunit PxpA n=1 Tax=Costertonia aggregata TaxID=343403 RepID=A0A7H9ATQ6_9FLAO|nr:5-oxoprolinase subunit PxpA [Costertonia aggregata]QLG46829.1 5-oxoprolinase subunit PxpA [Costertonia aggregata]